MRYVNTGGQNSPQQEDWLQQKLLHMNNAHGFQKRNEESARTYLPVLYMHHSIENCDSYAINANKLFFSHRYVWKNNNEHIGWTNTIPAFSAFLFLNICFKTRTKYLRKATWCQISKRIEPINQFKSSMKTWRRDNTCMSQEIHTGLTFCRGYFLVDVIHIIHAYFVWLALEQSFDWSKASKTSSIAWYFGPWEVWMKFRQVIFKLNLVIGGTVISCETALRWMPLDFTDDQSTMAQAIACYLSQCWPKFMSPYDVARSQ